MSEIEAMSGNPRFETLDRISRAVGLMVTLAPRTASSIAVATDVYLVAYGRVSNTGSASASAGSNNNLALAS